MTDKIRPPWTPEQVAVLNRFQQYGGMHPFTCGGKHRHNSPTLEAREDGWHCPATYCGYMQDWAHAFMADPSKWPQCSDGEGFCSIHGFHRHAPEPPPEPADAPRSAVQAADGPAEPQDAHDGPEAAQDGSLREQVQASIESEVYEFRERTMWWPEGGITQEIARLATRGAMEIRDRELEQLRAKVAEFDHIINWHTTCASCARILDSAYQETMRADRAENALAHARSLHRESCPLAQRKVGSAAFTCGMCDALELQEQP